jgi:membrane-associated protease RseP (regulator of RpoE activity)
MDNKAQVEGCPVQLVGPGTPAEKAGLKVGDLIKAVGERTIVSADSLKEALGRYKPGRKVKLKIVRGGKEQTLEATLTRYPMEVIRPPYPLEMMPPPEDGPLKENANDPLSLLMTMQQIDDKTIPDDDKIVEEVDKSLEKKALSAQEKSDFLTKEVLDRELQGVALRDGVRFVPRADRHSFSSPT